jgi:anti-anti-sigma factor
VTGERGSGRLEFTVEKFNPATVLGVAGAVDFHGADRLANQLTALLVSGVRRLVVDLTDVEFLGAAGANILRDCSRLTEASHRPVDLVCPTRAIRRVLTATGVDGLLAVYDSLSEALDVSHRCEY